MSERDNKLLEALYTLLNGDATLGALATGGVHRTRAPRTSGVEEPPVVVFKIVDEVPQKVLGNSDLYSRFRVDVYGIVEGTGTTVAADINERIKALLQDCVLTVTPYTWLSCERIRRIDLPSVSGGREFDMIGGAYSIWIQ